MRAELEELPDREELVLALYYDEMLTLSEIGDVHRSDRRDRIQPLPDPHHIGVVPQLSRMSANGVGSR